MAFARQASPGATSRTKQAPSADGAVHTTLLELVRTIGEITDEEAEVVATVLHMLRTGTVKLTGSFRDTSSDRFAD